MGEHKATLGVAAIPPDHEGKGLWSVRVDGKGINAIGGRVDPEDIAKGFSLIDVLKREFREEAGVEIMVPEERPLGVFPNANMSDIMILYSARIASGTPNPSAEASEHLWMDPFDVRRCAEAYDAGDHEWGLVSGVGKRQWNMSKAFFLNSFNPLYRLSAFHNLAPRLLKNGNKVGSIVIHDGSAYMVAGVKGRLLDPNLAPTESYDGFVPEKEDPRFVRVTADAYEDAGHWLYEDVFLLKIV